MREGVSERASMQANDRGKDAKLLQANADFIKNNNNINNKSLKV